MKIQPKTIDLSTRPWGITTEFVGFIPQSLMPRSIVLGWILIYRNWSKVVPDVVSVQCLMSVFGEPRCVMQARLEHAVRAKNPNSGYLYTVVYSRYEKPGETKMWNEFCGVWRTWTTTDNFLNAYISNLTLCSTTSFGIVLTKTKWLQWSIASFVAKI